MNQFEHIKDILMAEMINTPSHQVKPRDLEKKIAGQLGLSSFTVREAVKDLVEDKELTYTYRDPDNYLEIAPVEPHHAARPMKVVLDAHGTPWICDANVDLSSPLPDQGCWNCGDVAFTRDD